MYEFWYLFLHDAGIFWLTIFGLFVAVVVSYGIYDITKK